MLQNEFESLIGFKVDSEFYHKYVEPEYNRSCEDKDTWCKVWLKRQGIKEGVQNLIYLLGERMSVARKQKNELDTAKTEIQGLKEMLQKAEERIEDCSKKYSDCCRDYDQLLERKEDIEKQLLRYKLLNKDAKLSERDRQTLASYLVDYD